MAHTNRHRARSLLSLAIAAMFIVVVMAQATVPVAAATKTTRSAYHDQWRKLWEDHITWTRVVILGILDSLPGNSAYVDRLLQNPADMADALQPYYGAEATTFGNLVHDHLTIAAELLIAAKNGDTAGFNDAKTRWYANAHGIAVQMNKMNPSAWPVDETEKMWDAHLDATLKEASANLTGDYAAEVAAYDEVHDMALVMADFISNGVITQFPEKFQGK